MDRTSLREALQALASNHLWTWQYRTADLWPALPNHNPDRHPMVTIAALSDEQLDELLTDPHLNARGFRTQTPSGAFWNTSNNGPTKAIAWTGSAVKFSDGPLCRFLNVLRLGRLPP